MNDSENFAFPSRQALLCAAPHTSAGSLSLPHRGATLLKLLVPLKTVFEEENFASEQSVFKGRGVADYNVS